MVFSQTSLKTQSILKVVDIDRLKPEKNQQVNSSTGVVTNEDGSMLSAASSFSEAYLKTEPESESKMFSNTDCEFFQDLVQWCSGPAKEELVHTIDSPKITKERAYNTDTLHTPFSPQGWDAIDAKSTDCQTSFYNTVSNDPLSPSMEGITNFDNVYPLEKESKSLLQEQFLDINTLPVVIGDLAFEKEVVDANPWQAETVEWTNTLSTDYTKTSTHNTMPFIDQEDSLDLTSVIPREVESNDVIITEYIINDDRGKEVVLEKTTQEPRTGGLSLNVTAKAPAWPGDVISTPDVLNYVEQLEKEKCSIQNSNQTNLWPAQDMGFVSTDRCSETTLPPLDYEPITPKSESHSHADSEDDKPHSTKRRRHDSEDSDETYTPYPERSTPRKYKRRKPNVPIKDLIIALEGSQQLTKARRGRPPKRRESNVSSVCSVEDSSPSVSTQGDKYRELRDKNNEASKRSRMNRKLKELQMEQLAIELEERNKKLKVRADILEDMTKKLKEALMTAILQK